MAHDPDWQQIDEYLAGTASPEARARVERWLEQAPGRREALRALRDSAQGDATAWNVDAAWTRVFSSIGGERAAEARSTPVRTVDFRRSSSSRAWRIAAMLLVVAGAGLLGREALRTRGAGDATATAMREVVTGAGQRLAVTLPDGSRLTLNAGSRLRYDTLATGGRDVFLDGEAYFDVRHDERRPFRVHAHGRLAEDVGTRFVVRAYAEEAQVDVAVEEGAVRLLHPSDTARAALLTAGTLGRLGATGAPIVSTLPADNHYFAWTRGMLAFDGQTLHEAVPVLERWYGVTIRIGDSSLARKRLHATFERESLHDALAVLAVAIGAEYTETGRTITFSPRAK